MHISLFARLLLVFAMLLAQSGSMAHGVSHILTEQSGLEQSLPHDKYCDQCAAYAQIGSAVGSSGINFFGSEDFETLQVVNSGSFTSTTFVAFAARAPPYSV
jgi:hypothetical protein